MPDATLIVAQPYDPSQIPAIERAIRKSDLGLNPSSDGKVVRIPVPPLTEERRREIVKKAHDIAEHARNAVRQARREGNDRLKKKEKDRAISQDDERRGLDEVQKLHDHYIAEVSSALQQEGTADPGGVRAPSAGVPLRLPPRARGPAAPAARGGAGAGRPPARTGRRREEVEELCRRHRVPVEVVPERRLSEIAGPAHNGMAAEVRAGGRGGGAGGGSGGRPRPGGAARGRPGPAQPGRPAARLRGGRASAGC